MADTRGVLVSILHRPLILFAVVMASLVSGALGPARPALAATITVDTATDENTNNAACSLREAITAANTDAAYNGCAAGSGTDTIAFNVSGTALTVRTITLSNSLGALPSITTPLTIDGWSQGVNDGTVGYTGSPLIEMSGQNLTTTSIAGFTIDGAAANGVTIQGLTVNRFKSSLSAAIRVQNGASNVTVKGNYIGLNAAGTATAATSPNNNSFGIVVTGSTTTGVTIGGSTSAERNVIAGTNGAGANNGVGVRIESGANNVTIKGNYIGLKADGTGAVANARYGVQTSDATTTNITIGGSSAGERNVVSGNSTGGIQIQGGATYVTIKGNYVGLNAAGAAAVPNGSAGINVTGSGTGYVTIGGTSAGDRNIVSGNTSVAGIQTQSNASHITIQGNYVGTDPTGVSAIPNTYGMLILSTTDSVVGGTAAGAGNLVSGNSSAGIGMNGPLTNTVFQGNLIGTDATGAGLISGGSQGIFFTGAGGSAATIGGTTAGARNVIVGMTSYGINLNTGLVTNTTIQGNYIGVMPDGVTAAGNGSGIRMQGATGIVVGGTAPGAGNIIANSTGSTAATGKGVTATLNGATVLIRGNSIYNNGVGTSFPHLGIDLNDDGLTANDTGDDDIGPNGLLNSPVLTSAGVGGGVTRVTGTLNSVASTIYGIDVYANDACDPSGSGEGQIYLGSTSVTTDASGNGRFALTNLPAVTAGQSLTATASDTTLGTTSEFSACTSLTAPAITVSPTSGLMTTEAGASATFTVQLTVAPSADLTIGVSSSDTTEGTVSPSTLTFHADATALDPQTVTVTGANDAIKDGDIAYTVLLATAAGSDGVYAGTDPTDVSVTNQDDEESPTLSVTAIQANEGNSGTTPFVFAVTLGSAAGQPVTVQYITSNGSATGGGACSAGVDYIPATGMLTFAPGDTSKDVAVAVCGDALNEPDETFRIVLSNPTNATIISVTATATIQNDDTAPVLSVANAQVAEGASSAAPLTFTVTLGAASAQTVSVQYATSNGTATGGASCGTSVDYVAASGTLSFAPGQTSKQVSIMVCGDTLNEPDETFTLTLTSPTNATIAQGSATGVIQNYSVVACSPRPAVAVSQQVVNGKLMVHIATSALNSNEVNALQGLQFGALRNATVTLNGQQVTSGLSVSLPPATTSVNFTVERATPGQDTSVAFAVVDACGAWTTFVGAGPAAGF